MGLVARQLEAAGIATVSLSSARDITAAVNPPRAAYLDFPLGHTSGRPHQPELNRAVVAGALDALLSIDRPGTIVDLPFRWADSDDWKDRVMRARPRDEGDGETVDDRVARFPDPQYQSDADEQAALATHDGETCLVCAGIDY